MKSPVTPIALICIAAPAVLASPGREVTRSLHRYNADEQTLAASAEMVPAPQLFAHWQQLSAIKKQLAHVHVGALGEGERVLLRHELSTLLGSAVDVAQVRGDYVEEKVRTADDERRVALVGIAEWANRHLDFDVQEVLGVRLLASSRN
jgi:hypothetical protein